jgi:alkaline phosphatase D
MAAGVQAFYEWLPMREKPYSEYQLGDLATLFRLETRLTGRTEQLDLKEAINDHGEDIAAAAMSFRDGPLNDPTRSMMGAGQEQWLAESLATSTASGTKWQILAQQVIMGRSRMPEDFEAFFGPGDRPSNRKLAEMERAARLAAIGVPIHMDRWEGYPAARRRLLQASQNAEADLVVLSGDSHNAWAFNLDHNDQPVGVELAVQGVSSLGMDKRYHGDPATIAKRFVDANPDLVWCDTSQRGYMVLDIEAERIVNEWLFIPSRFARTAEVSATHRMQVTRGSRRLSFSE